MRKFAEANVKASDTFLIKLAGSQDWLGTIARIMVGHEIAKAQVRVSFTARMMRLLTGSLKKSQRRRVLGQLLGYDPFQPVLNKSFVGGAGITVTGANQEVDPRVLQDLAQ